MTARAVLALATVLAATPALAAEPPAHGALTVLHCPHLLDPAAGKLLGETTLIIDAGRIRDMHPVALTRAALQPRPRRTTAISASWTCPARPACPA